MLIKSKNSFKSNNNPLSQDDLQYQQNMYEKLEDPKLDELISKIDKILEG